MTRRQYISQIGRTWKGQQLRAACACACVNTPSYLDLLLHLAVNMTTADARHTLMRIYFTRKGAAS
jgi:hypothetical protein